MKGKPFFCPATPGPPYALTVVEVSKRHVDLKWEPPKSDGGRPITKYVHVNSVALLSVFCLVNI